MMKYLSDVQLDNNLSYFKIVKSLDDVHLDIKDTVHIVAGGSQLSGNSVGRINPVNVQSFKCKKKKINYLSMVCNITCNQFIYVIIILMKVKKLNNLCFRSISSRLVSVYQYLSLNISLWEKMVCIYYTRQILISKTLCLYSYVFRYTFSSIDGL